MSYRLQVFVGGREVGSWDLRRGDEYVVGRGSTCDVVVPDRSVSRRHCVAKLVDDGVEIADLGSANGLFVEGSVTKRYTARHGDSVGLGMAQMRFVKPENHTGMIPVSDLMAELDGFDSTSSDDGADGEDVPAATAAASDSIDAKESMPTSISTDRPEYRGLARERLEILIEAGKSLSQSHDLETVLERIMDHLFEILPVRRAVIALTDDGEVFDATVVRPQSDSAEMSSIASQSIIREVASSRQGRIVEDASLDQKLRGNMSIIAGNIKAALCVPIVSQDKCLGAIYADYPGRARLYGRADLDFLTAFSSIAGVSIANAQLAQQIRDNDRLKRDLDIAAEIQQGILPRDDLFTFPGLEIDWTYLPSLNVGGDFFDLIELEDGRLCALLGDVSGKSIPAALYMARVSSILRTAATGATDPGAVLTAANALLEIRDERCLFATVVLMMIDSENRTVEWANAGHNPVLVRYPSGKIDELGAQGPPVGIMPDSVYTSEMLHTEPGTLLTLYTDGLVEAHSAAGEEFGMERTTDIIHAGASGAVSGVTKSLLDAVRAHIRNSPHRRDDIAIMNVRVQ